MICLLYTSTRNGGVHVTASKAITDGISPDGGLYLPEEIPAFSADELRTLCSVGYRERAKHVLGKFLCDFTADEVNDCVENAYAGHKFASPQVAPVVKLDSTVSVLELFRGPTCAFKDMALQMLPHLLTVSAAKNLDHKEIVILVATSGDTGKAALEGFRDVPGTRILVFYPEDGVSAMQKLQMTTQEGGNVGVCAIRGNFDDAQNGVKAIFTNPEILEKFRENDLVFSSANSINWGRLAPQIVYYVSAYCDMVNAGTVSFGDAINIVVPTGNFGNILAAYFAREMGLPVKKLICASNANNVLTDFLATGTYDRNRHFYTTISPSMDILISSNLERLLYLLCGKDPATVRGWFASLAAEGRYTVSDDVRTKLGEIFVGGFCDDAATKQTIADTYRRFGYLPDTHTGVALRVLNEYLERTGDSTPAVVASTASPFKFPGAVLSALNGTTAADEFAAVEAIERLTGIAAPPQLLSLRGKPVRFSGAADRDAMPQVVFDMLGI